MVARYVVMVALLWVVGCLGCVRGNPVSPGSDLSRAELEARLQRLESQAGPDLSPVANEVADLRRQLAALANRKKKHMVILGGKWCGPCNVLDKDIEGNRDKLRTWLDKRYIVRHEPHTHAFAARYKIDRFPAAIVFETEDETDAEPGIVLGYPPTDRPEPVSEFTRAKYWMEEVAKVTGP